MPRLSPVAWFCGVFVFVLAFFGSFVHPLFDFCSGLPGGILGVPTLVQNCFYELRIEKKKVEKILKIENLFSDLLTSVAASDDLGSG